MAKHIKKKKKKPGPIQRAINTQRVNEAGRAAFSRQTRLNRGQDLAKDFGPEHSIVKTPSPGIRARARNLRVHGEQVPVSTGGKIDKGGPAHRVAVKFRQFVSASTARNTAKENAAKKKRKKT